MHPRFESISPFNLNSLGNYPQRSQALPCASSVVSDDGSAGLVIRNCRTLIACSRQERYGVAILLDILCRPHFTACRNGTARWRLFRCHQDVAITLSAVGIIARLRIRLTRLGMLIAAVKGPLCAVKGSCGPFSLAHRRSSANSMFRSQTQRGQGGACIGGALAARNKDGELSRLPASCPAISCTTRPAVEVTEALGRGAQPLLHEAHPQNCDECHTG
mmetsp:Transcript_2284/g.7313  ORF Transcript_2284/g.7313 Transcript_2284/m.7313 type:complete len:218 (+) Transcript_2284:408-1061(+)